MTTSGCVRIAMHTHPHTNAHTFVTLIYPHQQVATELTGKAQTSFICVNDSLTCVTRFTHIDESRPTYERETCWKFWQSKLFPTSFACGTAYVHIRDVTNTYTSHITRRNGLCPLCGCDYKSSAQVQHDTLPHSYACHTCDIIHDITYV